MPPKSTNSTFKDLDDAIQVAHQHINDVIPPTHHHMEEALQATI